MRWRISTVRLNSQFFKVAFIHLSMFSQFRVYVFYFRPSDCCKNHSTCLESVYTIPPSPLSFLLTRIFFDNRVCLAGLKLKASLTILCVSCHSFCCRIFASKNTCSITICNSLHHKLCFSTAGRKICSLLNGNDQSCLLGTCAINTWAVLTEM